MSSAHFSQFLLDCFAILAAGYVYVVVCFIDLRFVCRCCFSFFHHFSPLTEEGVIIRIRFSFFSFYVVCSCVAPSRTKTMWKSFYRQNNRVVSQFTPFRLFSHWALTTTKNKKTLPPVECVRCSMFHTNSFELAYQTIHK